VGLQCHQQLPNYGYVRYLFSTLTLQSTGNDSRQPVNNERWQSSWSNSSEDDVNPLTPTVAIWVQL